MFYGIFKAYDIRGKYPGEINEVEVGRIGEALGKHFAGKGKAAVIVGHDARLSSPRLYRSLLKGLKNTGRISPIKAGLITTPMLYFLVNRMRAKGGIIVTASHNPKEYNGLKVVGRGAIPIGGKEVEKLLKKRD